MNMLRPCKQTSTWRGVSANLWPSVEKYWPGSSSAKCMYLEKYCPGSTSTGRGHQVQSAPVCVLIHYCRRIERRCLNLHLKYINNRLCACAVQMLLTVAWNATKCSTFEVQYGKSTSTRTGVDHNRLFDPTSATWWTGSTYEMILPGTIISCGRLCKLGTYTRADQMWNSKSAKELDL